MLKQRLYLFMVYVTIRFCTTQQKEFVCVYESSKRR